jgi:two-component system sensor histidine kinase KdpD
VLDRLEGSLAGRPVHVSIPTELPLIAADEVLLNQVFVNILDNASRYTPEGTPIWVSAATSADGVSVEIADAGPGLAPGEAPRIWEKFYRGSASTGAGAGLGLAICRAIVLAHRGSISASNRAEGGASFKIWLPIAVLTSEPSGHD